MLLPRAPEGTVDAKELLLSHALAGTPAAGIASGGILLGKPIACGRFLAIPYEVKDHEGFPPYFHNGSEAYSFDIPILSPGPGETVSRFVFNDCPSRRPWCEVTAEVLVDWKKRGRRPVRVLFKGEPISQADEWVSLEWVQALTRPYFTASCAGTERRVLLAESLGPIPDGRTTMNRSLLAPYERSFHVDCPGPITEVSVGYEDSLAYVNGRPVAPRIPGRRLSVGG